MKKFEFSVRRELDYDFQYHSVFTIIERIKSYCSEYEFIEEVDNRLTDGFRFICNRDDKMGEYLDDYYLICLDSAENLLNLNESLSGKYGWDEVANLMENGKYKLKPKYAQLLIDNLNVLEAEMRKNYEILLATEKEKETKREIIKQSIASIETSVTPITDEGGKTKVCTHTITFHDGEKLTFTERNIFDFGVVVNPCYSVAPHLKPGGICSMVDGRYQWLDFVGGRDGWIPIRPLTENEETAIRYLNTFGGFVGQWIRM